MGTKRERQPGVWQLRVFAGRDPLDGRQLVVTETYRGSARGADQRLAELQSARRKLTRHTLGQAIALWRDQAGHAASTARNYDRARAEIPAKLAGTPVGKVTAAMIRELVARVVDYHGPARGRLVHAVVSGGLTHAWRMEWIADNPARRVALPAQARRVATTPTVEQLVALLDLVAGDAELAAWLAVSADSGARPGEVLALRWGALELDRGQLRIVGAVDPVTVAGRPPTIKPTKTGTARTVAISAPTVAALRKLRAAAVERALSVGVTLGDEAFVFARDPVGAVPWRTDLGAKRFARLRRRAGIAEGVRRYDLRHWMISELLDAGFAVKLAAGRAGHSRDATTTDVYGHRLAATDHAAAEHLGRRLGGQ